MEESRWEARLGRLLVLHQGYISYMERGDAPLLPEDPWAWPADELEEFIRTLGIRTRKPESYVAGASPAVKPPSVADVEYQDGANDSIRYELQGGQLVMLVNGSRRAGPMDTSGIVTSLAWTPRPGWGGNVRTQRRFGGSVPEPSLEPLRLLADASGIPHNIPCLPTGSRIHRVSFLNLTRRRDRLERHEEALRGVGLFGLAKRVEAVDGRELDLVALGADILPEALQEAQTAHNYVVGEILTPGAVGLIVTWHRLLRGLIADPEFQNPDRCVLVTEDDAEFLPSFAVRLRCCLAEADATDPDWAALQVGFFMDRMRMSPVRHKRMVNWIAKPKWLAGTSGIVVRGARGAEALLQALVPIRARGQLDACFSGFYHALPMYCSKLPLMTAPGSEDGDTDIQIPDPPGAPDRVGV